VPQFEHLQELFENPTHDGSIGSIKGYLVTSDVNIDIVELRFDQSKMFVALAQ